MTLDDIGLIFGTHLDVRTEPCLCRTLGVRGSRGEFFVVRDTFFSFPIFCDSFAVDVRPPVFYRSITFLPTALGARWVVVVVLVLLVAEPRFSPGFAPAVSQVACSRCCLHPVSPFCFCPHFCPPSSPPPLLTLVFSRPPSPACPAQPHRGIHPQKLTCIFRPTRRRRRRRRR